jgi:hypothetical protein
MPPFRSRRATREPFAGATAGDVVVDVPASHAAAVAERQTALRDSSHAMLQGAISARGEALDAIRDAERSAHAAEAQLQDTTVVLAQAQEQIDRIEDAADRIETTVDRSRRHLADIVRKMCRDRCFIGLLVVLLVVGTALAALFIRDSMQQQNNGDGGGDSSSTTVNVNNPPPSTATPARR